MKRPEGRGPSLHLPFTRLLVTFLIDINEQSVRLHDEVKQSKLHRIAGAGHMIQQSATPDLMAAINEAAAETLH